ncbi:MAG TPA: nitrite reductase (NAD(P)H) small subunit [Planctomycetota bacterium]|nr:nitrite reductase (NAD(P)H) small subunit [Planctomycetota bacterium]
MTDNVVTCPLHGWKFHLGTGKSVNHPGARVDTYPVRMGEAGRVEILLPAPGTV